MEVPRHSTAPLLQGPAKVSAKDGSGARPRALNMCREHAPTEKGHLQGSCDTITQSTKGCACFGLKDQSPIASKLKEAIGSGLCVPGVHASVACTCTSCHIRYPHRVHMTVCLSRLSGSRTAQAGSRSLSMAHQRFLTQRFRSRTHCRHM